MIQRDVLMRQVRQLTQALARVMASREQEQFDEAARHIEQAFRQLTGEKDPLRRYPIEQVLTQCSTKAGFSAELGTNVAALLKQEGDLLDARGRPEAACRCYVRALALYWRARAEKDAALPLNIGEKIERLEQRVDTCALTEAEQTALARVQPQR